MVWSQRARACSPASIAVASFPPLADANARLRQRYNCECSKILPLRSAPASCPPVLFLLPGRVRLPFLSKSCALMSSIYEKYCDHTYRVCLHVGCSPSYSSRNVDSTRWNLHFHQNVMGKQSTWQLTLILHCIIV